MSTRENERIVTWECETWDFVIPAGMGATEFSHIVIEEENEWEGELWEYVIQAPTNPEDLAAVELLPDIADWFSIRETNDPPNEYNSGRGYRAECVHLSGNIGQGLRKMIDDPSLSQEDIAGRLYKSQICQLASFRDENGDEER